MSAELGAPIFRACAVLEAPRSTVYARRSAGSEGAPAAKRGPKTPLSDAELLAAIREAIAHSPFAGEGHREVTARLRREKGISVGRKRVLRLMRQAGLLAPQRARGGREPRPHDGTIIPEAPNLLWGTDATMAHTRRDGWVWAFARVDHFSAEAWASVARRGDRLAACEPIYAAVRDRFGELGPDVARGIACRHGWGPRYTSSHFRGSLHWLGIEDSPAYVGEPPCNGCAERFIRTLKEQCIWSRTWESIEELAAGRGRVRRAVQHRVADRAARSPHAPRGVRRVGRDVEGGSMIPPVSGARRSAKTRLRGSQRLVSERFARIEGLSRSRRAHRDRRIVEGIRSGSCPRNRGRYKEFDAWRCRDLSGIELDVLYLDGTHFRYHAGAKAEPVLCAWGLTSEGKPLLVGLDGTSSESTDVWRGFLQGLVDRGLRPPLLVVSDGAPGLMDAIEICFSKALRQRCLVHRARNLIAKVPKHAQDTVKAEFWAIFNDIEEAPGEPAVAEARARARRFSTKWRKLYPGMVECLEEDFEALFAHLRLPKAYWMRCRHSNLIERSFGETRRRVKVIGRLPGEQSCLSLCWAVLDRASKGWRGIELTLATIRLLHELRRELYGEAAMREQQEVVIETANDVTPAA